MSKRQQARPVATTRPKAARPRYAPPTSHRIIEALRDVVLKAIPWAGLALVTYFFSDAVGALAGKETNANLNLLGLVKVGADRWIAYMFAGGACLYGWRQRKLRGDKVQGMSSHVRALESRLDPGRSSSSLTERGETSPTDEHS